MIIFTTLMSTLFEWIEPQSWNFTFTFWSHRQSFMCVSCRVVIQLWWQIVPNNNQITHSAFAVVSRTEGVFINTFYHHWQKHRLTRWRWYQLKIHVHSCDEPRWIISLQCNITPPHLHCVCARHRTCPHSVWFFFVLFFSSFSLGFFTVQFLFYTLKSSKLNT